MRNVEPLLARERRELHLQALEYVAQGKDRDIGFEPAGIEA